MDFTGPEKNQSQIQSTVVDDVKDVHELIIKPNEVLIKVEITNETSLILPDSVKETRWTIDLAGEAVTLYKVGDVVLDIEEKQASFFRINNKPYLTIMQYGVKLATKADNMEDKK